MELEFKQSHIHGYELVLESTIPYEETMEMIVPDTCPDIAQILDTEATCFLRTKESQDGRGEITALVRATVLYSPEGANGVRKLDLNLPITCRTEQGSITSACKIVACPRMEGVETRMLNSRKVLVRANVLLEISIYAPTEQTLCYNASGDEDWGIETLAEIEDTYLPVCVQEKQFTHSDQITISNNRPEVEELLKSRVTLTCPERKIIGNKLIIKGVAHLHLLYRTENHSLCTTDHELPFSQIMEIQGAGEESAIEMTAILTSGEFHLVGNDGHTLGVNLGILLQSTMGEGLSLPLLKDLYSTNYQLNPEYSSYHFSRLMDEGVKSQSECTLISLESPPQAVCDVYTEMGSMGQGREGNRLAVATQHQVTVLYEGAEGEIKSHLCVIPVSCELEVPADALCHCTCEGEVYATPTAGGIEVRLVATFTYRVIEHRTVQGIRGGALLEKEEQEGQKPSMILRMVSSGERLWDIAKNYGTTTEEICSANQLEDGVLAEQLLLIPKKR